MKITSVHSKLSVFVQLALGLIFVYSGFSKIMNMDAFLTIVRNYELLPADAEKIVAFSVPWIEFILGSFLLLGIIIKKSAIALSFLLIVFMIAMLVNIFRGNDFSCGCFSLSLEKRSGTPAMWWIVRDIGILLFCSILIINKRAFVYIKKP
jgi:uncharacterized membrane protein YphA (DoxX/SURF4 family)